jgi:hypothetical protein
VPVALFPFSPVWPKSDSPKLLPPRIYHVVIARSISADMQTVDGNGDESWIGGRLQEDRRGAIRGVSVHGRSLVTVIS